MKKFYLYLVVFVWVVISLSVNDVLAQEEPGKMDKDSSMDDLIELSLEELMQIEVVTASNVGEKLSKAPATIIVITDKDIEERGYMEMFDILNDLPGFDLSRAFGDDNYYLYARGYRKTVSDQMLFMIDGIIMNHLYNNNMNAFLQYSMANIKQVEIVYGPASAVYGPNAFAGVINVITKKEKSTFMASGGANNTSLIDLTINQNVGDLHVGLTGRLYATDGHNFVNRTPFLHESFYTNQAIWGPFANTEFLSAKSPINSNYLSGNVNYKGLEVGFINWFKETGYGTEWPSDKVLPSSTWQFDEQTYYARYETTLGKLNSKTLLRTRQSGNPEGSLFLERYEYDGEFGVDASYWHTTNKSYSFFQDFSVPVKDWLFMNFGLKYDRRTMQKGYDVIYGDFIPQDQIGGYEFPALPNRSAPTQHNHYTLQDKGLYTQAKVTPIENLDLYAGLRFDYNSIWKGVWSPRLGAVYSVTPNIIAKAFFGTAFLEPTARSLYGGWAGSLSNPNLRPERIKTFEGSIGYTKSNLATGLNFYHNIGYDAISSVEGKPVNMGERRMTGLELFAKYLYTHHNGFINKFKADMFVSYLNSTEDLSGTGDFINTGNMAPYKVKLILTASLKNNINVSLQNRYASEIETVKSNPLKTINSSMVSDLNVSYKNLFVKGLSAGAKIYNIFDVDYFHPGYRDASAGETAFVEGVHQESLGWYSSRLPQPGRTGHVYLKFDF